VEHVLVVPVVARPGASFDTSSEDSDDCEIDAPPDSGLGEHAPGEKGEIEILAKVNRRNPEQMMLHY